MKRFMNQKWFLSLVSLLLAILMVIYIDETQTGFVTQGQNSRTRQTATETQTIKVPLQVSVDTDRYYVVGYPEKVKISLTGSNALVTSAINTQNFRAYIDLSSLQVGQHKVKVKVTGLSKQLSYRLSPNTVTVDMEKRKSRSLPVQIEYNKNAVASGYHLGKASADPGQVNVTGARSEIDQIDQIVAKPELPNNLDHDYSRQVMLVAEDKRGRQLNVVIQPTAVHVEIPVTISHKKVRLSLISSNESSNRVYSVTANENEITLYGNKKDLAKVNKLTLKVDLKGITSTTSKNYRVPLPKGVVKASPDSVSVQIKVKSAGTIKQN